MATKIFAFTIYQYFHRISVPPKINESVFLSLISIRNFRFQAAKCCCGDGFFFDFPRKKCEVSANVGFMFGRLNNGWSHMAVYGFAYPMILLMLVAPLCAVMLGMGKREKEKEIDDFRIHCIK
uniref:Col_cuticle_N domain-containing protein n=1 Tax=Caenorhabditis tropicalis TaxID=1561998 RepID=A0A1I7UD01_9PELO